MKRFCKDCRFFEPIDERFGLTNGWCKRFPPVYTGRPTSSDCEFTDVTDSRCWSNPVVGIFATCGEWKKVNRGKDS